MGKKWFLIAIVGGFIAIILATVTEVLTVSNGLQILITYALVLITAEYATSAGRQAKFSSTMAKEMQESRLSSSKPILVMGRTIAYGVIKDVRQVAEQKRVGDRTFLYNVGTGPALNIQFYLKIPNRMGSSRSLAGTELRALSTQEGYEMNMDAIFGHGIQAGIQDSHDLVVEYEDIFGGKWCSGLELVCSEAPSEYEVAKLFYEKMACPHK